MSASQGLQRAGSSRTTAPVPRTQRASLPSTSTATSRWTPVPSQSTARRSLFSSVPSSRPHANVSHATRGFYGRSEQEDGLEHWRPGEVIVPPVQDVIGELKRSMHTMISNMQTNISAEFQSLQESVSSLTERVLDVEFQLSSSMTPSSTTSSGSELESSGNRRKRCIPIELQSQIREVYKNLPSEKKLNLAEGIGSDHNGTVIKAVCNGLGEKVGIDDIRSGMTIYRRSLKRTTTDSEREKKLQRSRQQRVWDRRSKYISVEESEKWKDVNPVMMSDEETIDSKTLKRKRPEWRSVEFNSLIDEIEKRYENNSKHPRKERVYGSPLKCCAPASAKEWMIMIKSVMLPSSPDILP